MKRKNVSALKLNKKLVSDLHSSLKGGTRQLPTDAEGCTFVITDNCSSGDPDKMCRPCP